VGVVVLSSRPRRPPADSDKKGNNVLLRGDKVRVIKKGIVRNGKPVAVGTELFVLADHYGSKYVHCGETFDPRSDLHLGYLYAPGDVERDD
jgi:hypothetical protein